MSVISRTALARGKAARVPLLSARAIHGPAMPTNEELYDEVAQYPAIPRFRNEDEKMEAEHAEKVKGMRTVEEKQYYVNLPKYFGWKAYVMDTAKVPPAALPSVQFTTNTTTVEGLPSPYNDLKGKSEEVAECVAPLVKSALAFAAVSCEEGYSVENDRVLYHEHSAVRTDLLDHSLSHLKNRSAVKGIHRVINGKVSSLEEHARTAANDNEPRNEAFWFRGPMDPERSKLKGRQIRYNFQTENRNTNERWTNFYYSPPYTKEWVQQQHDYPIQMVGSLIHEQVRTVKALPPFIPMSDPLVKSGPVPLHDYQPVQSGWTRKRRFGTNLAGTWTGTERANPYLVIADNYNIQKESWESAESDPESNHYGRPDRLLAQSVLHGFGMTYAQACNHGFSPFNDPTAPFTGQVMLTDGKRWKLSAYQLNKMALQGISETNDQMLRNVCWHEPERELYTEVNPESGEVTGFDMDLLADIVRMYLIQPTVDTIPNQDEYLDPVKNHTYKLENSYNREAFTQNHRHMMSNRPRHTVSESYKYIDWWQRIWNQYTKVMHAYGDREKTPWTRERHGCRGRQYWNPEYRWYDNHPGARVPKKFRTKQLDGFMGGGNKTQGCRAHAPVVTAPLPRDTPDS